MTMVQPTVYTQYQRSWDPTRGLTWVPANPDAGKSCLQGSLDKYRQDMKQAHWSQKLNEMRERLQSLILDVQCRLDSLLNARRRFNSLFNVQNYLSSLLDVQRHLYSLLDVKRYLKSHQDFLRFLFPQQHSLDASYSFHYCKNFLTQLLNEVSYVASCLNIESRINLILFHLQRILLKTNKLSMFWKKAVCVFLLFSSFSEFPSRRRPPCTTMPWTIWPALIILWGVCWMFYEPLNPQWEIDLLDIEDSESGQLLRLDCNLPDFDWDAPEWSLPHPDFIDPEQQLQQLMPGLCSSLTIPESRDSLQISSTVKPQDTISPWVSTDEAPGTFNVATSVATSSATREIGEEQQLEAVEPTAFAAPDIPSPFHEKPRDGPQNVDTDARHTKGFQNSRHGHIQKYYCPYPNCGRSKEGFGFRRKDHLDQHLKGPHKQSSVARLRGRPATGTSSFNSVATSDIAQALSQTKKRKHNGHGDLDEHSVNEPSDVLVKELAEERRLRLEAEQENQRLRQKLEKYEERMEKYEERLDRMMTLFGNKKSEETNLG